MSDVIISDSLKRSIIDECIQEEWLIDHYPHLARGNVDVDVLPDELFPFSWGLLVGIVNHYIKDKGYLSNLQLRKKQLIYKDFYGDEVTADWDNEVKNFVKNRVDSIHQYLYLKMPKTLINEFNKYNLVSFFCETNLEAIVEIIQNFIDSEIRLDTYTSNNDLSENEKNIESIEEQSIDPYEYEKAIADIFLSLGWTTFTTPKSGDQGADIIMQKEGFTYVVQCKLYNQPVGNKAVQEVTSAQAYYEAIGAVVITNNDYTKSARQLAESQNVWLLHDSQLAEWNSLIDDIITRVKENIHE